MIVIGADTHKGSHALAAVDEGTGKVRGHREIKADDAGHLAAVRWARGLEGEREPGKSDEIDALAVARAVVKDGVEQFPVAFLDERAMEIRLISDHRNDLVA